MRTEKADLYKELPPELVSRFITTFLSRDDCYPLQLDIGSYVTIRNPLTPYLVKQHLKGVVTLGAYALDQDSNARWLCLDADQAEQWQRLIQAAQQLATEDVPSYLEQSRRGGHLWLFVSPTPGSIIRQFGKQLLKQYGLSKVELYPKQDSLKTCPGSLVRLPLGIHRKTGKRYYFITPDGEPLASTVTEQIHLLSSPTLVPQTFISHLLERFPETSTYSPTSPITAREHGTGETLSDRLKNTVSVYQFVRHYVVLDQQGKGHCPFHQDEHKSFQVNEKDNYWHCYAGCGGGSIIYFWQKWRETHGENGSFVETVKDLRKLGVGNIKGRQNQSGELDSAESEHGRADADSRRRQRA